MRYKTALHTFKEAEETLEDDKVHGSGISWLHREPQYSYELLPFILLNLPQLRN